MHPRPDVAAKMGAPNACNNCHAKNCAMGSRCDSPVDGKPPASLEFRRALRAGSLPRRRAALLGLIETRRNRRSRAPAIARGPVLTPLTIDAVARTPTIPIRWYAGSGRGSP
jgi:hypothetical protein